MALPKPFRLTQRAQYLKVYAGEKKYHVPYLVIYVLSPCSDKAFGFTVSKKIGNAVVRNRVRRRLSEIVYGALNRFPDHSWIVFNAKKASATATFQELEKAVMRFIERLDEDRTSLAD